MIDSALYLYEEGNRAFGKIDEYLAEQNTTRK